MKLGVDIHGTIDACPELFSKLIKRFRDISTEVHIITGIKITQEVLDELEEWGIEYDYIFSITDYHESIGTKINYDEVGDPWIDEEIWNRTKGDYCEREDIDVCIDDSPLYGEYFRNTVYIKFEKEAVELLDVLLGV